MIEGKIPEAAGRAAFHCDELLSRTRTPANLDHEFARLASNLGEHLREQLAGLCDDRGLTLEVANAASATVKDWNAEVGECHRHAFLKQAGVKHGFLISVSIGELVAQFERILGGAGEVDRECSVLPASAVRFAQQFEQRIADSLRGALERQDLSLTASGEDIEQVSPFETDNEIWTATFSIASTKETGSWSVRVAASQAMIAELVGTSADLNTSSPTIGERGLDGSAISEINLPLRAVLVDVPMSVARLSSLEPGAVIPVAVNRSVPLLTGKLTIGHGCVGELDDRVALELTQASLKE